MMISMSRIGEVASSSMVPLRFSSANRRIVIIGIKNSPMTLVLESSGRMTYSLMFIGLPGRASALPCPAMTK